MLNDENDDDGRELWSYESDERGVYLGDAGMTESCSELSEAF
jgi:hypothetical protein